MLGCFRTGDANDPEIYITAVIAVLCSYDADIVRRVTSPTIGLPSRLKWLPSVAEVREECDRLVAIADRAVEQQARRVQQLRDREEYQFQQQVERPRRLSIAELKEKYGDWHSRTKERVHKSAEARAKLIAQIGQQAFDALPNAKAREGV